MSLRDNSANSCFIQASLCCSCCEITNDEEKDEHVLCRIYHNLAALFMDPCHSLLLEVSNYSKKKTNDNEVDPQKLTEKRAIKIENGDTVTFMAILHQQ